MSLSQPQGPQASRDSTDGNDQERLDAREDLLELPGSGIFAWKGAPRYGRQDLGYTPGGAQDRFALRSGNILLGNDRDTPALEIVQPPRSIRFLRDCTFVLTGGRREARLVERDDATGAREARLEIPAGDSRPIHHAVVYHAPAGSELRITRRILGFRTCLCCREADGNAMRYVGRARGPFYRVFDWPDREGLIRVVAGPEEDRLVDPEDFLGRTWVASDEMNAMGVRLCPTEDGTLPETTAEQMVSAPVCDGTVQMTPAGPIVLLRDRQTTGGYPRVFVVISADVDLVAQIGPGDPLRFRRVSQDEARDVALKQEEELLELGRWSR